jgi:DNA-binding transcriptional ArsR family regulator
MAMRDFMAVAKALGDQTRIRMLLALREGELCVCQITEVFGLAPSTISKHLSILYQAGLVNSRKEGRWMYYTLPGKHVPAHVRHAIEWVRKDLAEDECILADVAKLKRVLAMDPVELCKRQCRN